jgi:hypothetical protein
MSTLPGLAPWDEPVNYDTRPNSSEVQLLKRGDARERVKLMKRTQSLKGKPCA